jgi:hypothetical protein
MPIQIGDDPPPPPTFAEKIAPWLRRVIIGGCLVWVCFSMQDFLIDTRSHTIKISYPLLMGHEKITAPQPGFDPQKALWVPVNTAFPVADGTVLFIKTGDSVFAVKLVRQTIKPEQAQYEYLKVGAADPVVKGTAEPEPGGLILAGHRIGWTGQNDGAGYLYLDDSFIWNQPPRFTIGLPFQSGNLEPFRHALPASVHFESLPWKINAPPADDIIPAP